MKKRNILSAILIPSVLHLCRAFQCSVASKTRRIVNKGPSHRKSITVQSSLHPKLHASLIHDDQSHSVSSAARLGLSTLFTIQDFFVALAATQDFAVERLQYACAILLADMSSVSGDISGMIMPASLKINVSIILQRLMSLATFRLIQEEIAIDGFLLESIMIQIAISESYRSIRTHFIPTNGTEVGGNRNTSVFGRTTVESNKI